MKKIIYAVILTAIMAITLQQTTTPAQATDEVHLNQPFTIHMNEELKLSGYPISIMYIRKNLPVDCFMGHCPGPYATFVFYYPFGSNEVVFAEGETQTYKGASMRVTNITDTSATVIASTSALPHPIGTNIKTSDGTIWTINDNYSRRPYTSAGAFLSYGFNKFSTVVEANSADIELPTGEFIPPADGTILCSDRGSDKGTCYLTDFDGKTGFTSEAAFKGLGFSFSNALTGDTSWLFTDDQLISSPTEAHRSGVLLKKNGAIYLIVYRYQDFTALYAIPNMEVFNSWGFQLKNVVQANDADKIPTDNPVLPMRQPGQMRYE